MEITKAKKRVKPDWLKISIPFGEEYVKVKKLVKDNGLHTICEDGKCPNMAECWGSGTATFMILGNICTRSCSFCAVKTGRPTEYDVQEPQKVAEAIQKMNVKHAVITSVNRDELKDKGASIWAATIREVRKNNPKVTMEVLIPDFKADWNALKTVVDEKPEVISHNMETVARLYRLVRPQAKYHRSLEQIRKTKEMGARTKSGVMLGLGETEEEIIQIMKDLYQNGCDVLTLGQYLQPTHMHLKVDRFVHPQEFAKFKEIGEKEIGFDIVESGPMVRSSYHAEKHI